MRKSLFSRSIHLIFGCHLGLVAVTFILNVLLIMWVSALPITCPYHANRFCVTTDLIGVTFPIPLMVSFLIRPFLVFPLLHLSIFISVVCKRCSCCLRSAQLSLPYNFAGLTTVLYSLLFSFTGTFLSHITPDRSHHRDQPTFIRPSTSFPHPLLPYVTEPKYFKLFTYGSGSLLSSLHPVDEMVSGSLL